MNRFAAASVPFLAFFSLFLAPAAYADDSMMSKDSMKMSKPEHHMKKDAMTHKDTMMKKDSMMKDGAQK